MVSMKWTRVEIGEARVRVVPASLSVSTLAQSEFFSPATHSLLAQLHIGDTQKLLQSYGKACAGIDAKAVCNDDEKTVSVISLIAQVAMLKGSRERGDDLLGDLEQALSWKQYESVRPCYSPNLPQTLTSQLSRGAFGIGPSLTRRKGCLRSGR